jgi:hypothetical protein
MTFFTTNIFSQLSKGKLKIDFAGNYIETLDNIHTVAVDLNGRTNLLDLNLSMGYSLSNSIIWGFGLNYGHVKNINHSVLWIPSYANNPAFAMDEKIETKSTIIAPLMYFKYYKQLINKLYINFNLSSSYGFVNSKSTTMLIKASSFSGSYEQLGDQFSLLVSNGNENNKDSYYLSCYLQPEIEYFITDQLGIMIQLGGIRYNNYDGKDHDWRVSFNPSYWSYGLSFSIGKGFISQQNK